MPSRGKQNQSKDDEKDQAVEQWKIKKLISKLDNLRGNGTSMISLIIPPKDQISRVSKMLADELGTAANIKSRVNRQSVLGAITSVQQKLKLYNRVPPNGLVIYCGTVLTDEGKEKKLSIAIEPFKPINTSLYRCASRFQTADLQELLQSDDKFGFIVMDGNGTLFGTLAGNTRTVLHKFTVDLPKKHGRGGQSALRFARLRLEKRHHYVRKVAELATSLFITNDRPNVTGLVLAGSAEFKQKLNASDLFDSRLHEIVAKVVDVSYGGENGFNQAIELAADSLADVKFIREKKMLSSYFSEISRDTGKFCYGVKDTIQALYMGAISDLIVWENLVIWRYELRHPLTGETDHYYFNEQQEKNPQSFRSRDGVELDVVGEKESLLEWLTNNYRNHGATLHFCTNRSQEGSQFCRGFGGIGGILRYVLDFASMEVQEDYDDYDDSDGDFM